MQIKILKTEFAFLSNGKWLFQKWKIRGSRETEAVGDAAEEEVGRGRGRGSGDR